MVPTGTVVMLHTGDVATEILHWVRTLPASVRLITVRGHQIPRQRNMGADAAVGEWILYLDSDCVPRADTLQGLLDADVPLVSAVVLERFPPFRPTAVRSLDPPVRWDLAQLPRSGLLDVPAVGTGCLLVRRELLRAMAPPWFRCGQVVPDLLLEDMEFCLRASEQAGCRPQLACGVRVGHRIGEGGIIWPGMDGAPWLQFAGPGGYWSKFNFEDGTATTVTESDGVVEEALGGSMPGDGRGMASPFVGVS